MPASLLMQFPPHLKSLATWIVHYYSAVKSSGLFGVLFCQSLDKWEQFTGQLAETDAAEKETTAALVKWVEESAMINSR